MVATTIEQSRRLLELGLDPKTADMVWMSGKWLYSIKDNILDKEDFKEIDTLSWSLTALLEVMPPFIKGHHLKIEKTRITNMWYLDYQYLTDSEPRKDLLTAAYEMVCWLLEQGLIKKGGQDD